MTDPIKFKHFVYSNKKELSQWGGFFLGIWIIYHVLSDGQFSFFLTLSVSVQMFGFFLICWRVIKSQSSAGLSIHTFICYFVSFLSRVFSIIRFQSYLPTDKTGDWFYQLVECISLFLSLSAIILINFKYKTSYNSDLDQIKSYYLIIPTFILAILIHPANNQSFLEDFTWAFALYLEAVAMLPQIYLFTKKVIKKKAIIHFQEGEIESFTSHYVASQGISKILGLFFWIFTFQELNSSTSYFSLAPSFAGYFALAAQIIQILLLTDFLYHYIRSISSGLPMTLPTYNI